MQQTASAGVLNRHYVSILFRLSPHECPIVLYTLVHPAFETTSLAELSLETQLHPIF